MSSTGILYRISQLGVSAGRCKSRDDLIVGAQVDLFDDGDCPPVRRLWTLTDVPHGSVSVLIPQPLGMSAFLPDRAGSFRVRCQDTASTHSFDDVYFECAIRVKGFRIPAFSEEAEFNTQPGAPALENLIGWARELENIQTRVAAEGFGVQIDDAGTWLPYSFLLNFKNGNYSAEHRGRIDAAIGRYQTVSFCSSMFVKPFNVCANGGTLVVNACNLCQPGDSVFLPALSGSGNVVKVINANNSVPITVTGTINDWLLVTRANDTVTSSASFIDLPATGPYPAAWYICE